MKKIKLLSIALTLIMIVSITSTLFISVNAEDAVEYDFSSITTETALNTAVSKLTTAINNGATSIVINYGDAYYVETEETDSNGDPVRVYFNHKVNSAIKASDAADGSIDLTINGKYGGHVWKSLAENTKLKTVNLPDSIILASDLFNGSTNITYVYAPKAYYIGNNVFKDCTSLNLVILSTSNDFIFFEEEWLDTFGGTSSNVTLALKCSKSSEVTNNTWKTMQFKSIVYAHNASNCTASGASINGYCNICEKTVLALTIKAPENLVYNGLSKEATVDSNFISMSIPEIVYKEGNTVLSAPPTDVGTYTANITVDSATASVSFTIQKKTVTVKADNKNVCVDGELNLSYTAEGFEGNDTFTVEPNLRCNADIETVGEYPISISGAEASENYDIKYVDGTLTVQNHSYDELEHFDVDMHKKVCDCGDFIYEDHEWDKGEITKPASCKEEGETLFTCTICKDTTTESIPMLKHTDENNDSKCDDCSEDISDTDNGDGDDSSNNDNNENNGGNSNTNDNASNDGNSNADSNDNAGENASDNISNENGGNGEDGKNEENVKTDSEDTDKKSARGCKGCRSSASISAIAIISVISMAAVIKKKED